jgi:class 3 adenylate cyclase/tetratricopeptide (TPR) repeat protein
VHRIVPDLIIENYRTGNYRGSMRAAGMFLDISGFSGMTDALMQHGEHGPEVLAEMMRAVFDPIVSAIFAQGGIIVGYAGDAISALYPVEADDASACRRALAAAFIIQQTLHSKQPYETNYGTFRISAKIGLSLGAVSWAILRARDDSTATYYFRGEAVTEAARAEQHAGAGDIVLTDKVCEQLKVDGDSLGSFRLLRGRVDELPSPRPVSLAPVDARISGIFAPIQVVEQDMRGEFRQTVHLFMRMPDLADEQLSEFMYSVFDLQVRYGGVIDRIDFGDKGCTMIVLWGAPVAYKNDIGRALNFVLDLQEKVDFPIAAGVTYYISHAGYVGGELFEAYTCYGWGINLASRFMMGAAEGEIWIDERIAPRIAKRFHFDFVGEQVFKGFAARQKVYVLRERKPDLETFFNGEMVGREAELQALTDFVAPIWEGKYAGMVCVWGEAGMGKSRLIHEFRHLPGRNHHSWKWAVCQSDQILRHSFNPFRYWLLHYFDLHSSMDEATRLQKFLARLDALYSVTSDPALVAELNRTRSFLAALVDLGWSGSLYEQLDAQGRYDNTIIALISLVKAESLQQPFILFVEDAQYIDEDSEAFLLRLKRSLMAEKMDYPVAILLNSRWQGIKVLLERGIADRDIDLPGLSGDSISLIAKDILGGPASFSLVEVVDKRAEGNPFFAEQILHYLRDEGLLELNTSKAWAVKRTIRLSTLPADISVMLVARLDQLTHQVKEVVQAASVLGREFEVRVLARMLTNEVALQNEIEDAERAAIWSPLREIRYIFNHALMRDVAYGMQLQARRQELHALAFEALKMIYADEVDHHYGELAYHSEQAGLTDEACRYLSLAGDAARDRYQNTQALDYYRRALEVVPQAERETYFRLHCECEKILAELGRPEEQSREIEILEALADAEGEPGCLADVMLRKSRFINSSGNYEKAVELAEQAKTLALKVGRRDFAIGAHQALLDASYQQGRYQEAIQHGETGIVFARELNALQEEAFILNHLGLTMLEMKNPSAALDYFEKSLSIFRAEENLRGTARVLANFGIVAGYQGKFNVALDYCEQSLQLAREIGSRQGEGLLLGNMGWIAGMLGDYQKARTYTERNLLIAREIDNRYLETMSLINLSSHAGALGDFAAAVECAEQALERARSSGDRNAEAWAWTYLGHGLFDSGRADEARQAYRDGLAVREELNQPGLATEPAAGLARIALMQGDLASAQAQIQGILTQLEQDSALEGTDQPLRVHLSCYLVLRALHDARADAILDAAYAMLKARADGIPDPSTRQLFLENVTYNREILSLWDERG